MIYKVFVDDSGPKEYKTPYAKSFVDTPPPFEGSEQFWRDNYFVLCAVRVKQEDMAEINKEMNQLKVQYFGTKNVEVKSVWLRNNNQRKKHYLEPFKMTNEQLNEFGKSLINLIEKHSDKMKLIAVVFDKRYYGGKRLLADGNPLYKSTQVLFERINKCGQYNLVIFDQMDESLKVTKGHHKAMVGIKDGNKGMTQVYTNEYESITDVSFAHSHNENFLQIADICAYNVHRQFTEYGRDWCGENKNEEGKKVLRDYPYFNKIRCNFRYDSNGQVRGVGLICVPDVEKINWDLLKDCNIKI